MAVSKRLTHYIAFHLTPKIINTIDVMLSDFLSIHCRAMVDLVVLKIKQLK